MRMNTATAVGGFHPATAGAVPTGWAGTPALAWAAEQRILAAGSQGGSCHEITAGIVRLERVTAAGHRRIIRLAGPGDLIGQEALLGQPYRNDAVACTPVLLRRLALPPAGAGPQGLLPSTLLQRWQQTLDASEFWCTEISAGNARRRMLQLLAQLQCHRDDRGLVWLPKRDQMGDMLHLTVETCSRVLSALRREQVIVLAPPRQAWLDTQRLQAALALADH
jgi:CRP-like cAMP-binding protein